MPDKIGTLVVPHASGYDEMRPIIEENLVEACGGFSRYTGVGAWVDDEGEKHIESHDMYRFAYDSNEVGRGWFEGIAKGVKQELDQDAVYLETQDATVTFE